MALATRTARRPSTSATLWNSTVGKKAVMAVTGLVMLAFLVVHMLGNLKVFFGAAQFDGYAAWLRTIGEPFMHYEWTLWVVRVVLVLAEVASVWTIVVLPVIVAVVVKANDVLAGNLRTAYRQPKRRG